jgi:uncharacterized membrane protein
MKLLDKIQMAKRMKKQLVIIGIVALLVCVGLSGYSIYEEKNSLKKLISKYFRPCHVS